MKTCRIGHLFPEEKRQCPICQAESTKRSHQRNSKARSAATVAYFQKHKDKKSENNKLYWERHPDKVKQHTKRFKEKRPLLSVYSGMKSRCCNPNDSNYENYGGRDINIADDWLGLGGHERFEADMSPRPTSRHTLDRIDNDLGYSKENCKWSTRREQGLNRRVTPMLTICGRTKSKAEWAKELGLSTTGFNGRLKRGWSEERLLERVHSNKQVPLGKVRRLENAVVRMFQVLKDSDFYGRDEVVELLKNIGLFSVAYGQS